MEIAAQVAAAVSVSRGRVSVRICEHRGQTLALEVSLWEAQAGSSGRGSQMTVIVLASELMRQAFIQAQDRPLLLHRPCKVDWHPSVMEAHM